MHPFYRSRQALLSVVLHLAEKRKQPFWLEENALMQLAPELAQRDLRFILLVKPQRAWYAVVRLHRFSLLCNRMALHFPFSPM